MVALASELGRVSGALEAESDGLADGGRAESMKVRKLALIALIPLAALACSSKAQPTTNDWDELFQKCNYLPATSVEVAGATVTPASMCIGSLLGTSDAGVIDVLFSLVPGNGGTGPDVEVTFPANTGASATPEPLEEFPVQCASPNGLIGSGIVGWCSA